MNSLKEIDLWSNKLKKIPIIFENISSLEQLYLQENPIETFPTVFGSLKKAEKNNNYFLNQKQKT